MVSGARLGVRRRYRDDVRLYSRYAKTGWQWCHVLVSASDFATAKMPASTRVTLREGGSGVTCSFRAPRSEEQTFEVQLAATISNDVSCLKEYYIR